MVGEEGLPEGAGGGGGRRGERGESGGEAAGGKGGEGGQIEGARGKERGDIGERSASPSSLLAQGLLSRKDPCSTTHRRMTTHPRLNTILSCTLCFTNSICRHFILFLPYLLKTVSFKHHQGILQWAMVHSLLSC